MPTVAFSVFHDHILPELPKATTGMVDLHLLHTARDFCERTSAWRFAFAVSSAADQDTYDISVPDTASEIVRVTRLTVDDELLWDVDWTPESQGEDPKYDKGEPPFSMNNLNTELVFLEDEIPTASGTDNIEIVAALKPGFSATVLPDFLKFQHLEAMRLGTLQRLMQMGNKPWSDRQLAGKYAADYQAICLAASTTAKRGNTRAPLRSRKWG